MAVDRDQTALLIVDVQNDFCPGGALAVKDGDAVVEPLGRLAARFAEAGRPVYASRDWHPPESRHFRAHGGTWPVHCVAGTAGARYHPALALPPGSVIFSKGIAPEAEGYSVWDEGRTPGGTRLEDELRRREVRRLYVGGLATDYCVKEAVLGALRLGFDAVVLDDAIAAVDVEPGDGARAIEEMRRAGARFTTSDQVEP